MSTFFGKKTLVTALLISTAVSGSFLAAQVGPAGAPASMPAADKPIATIVGKDINNAAFYNLLMQVAGMRVFQQVFDLTLVQSDCVRNDIPISAGEVDKDGKPTTAEGKDFQSRLEAELKRTKEGIAPAGTAEGDRDKILGATLQAKGITGIEFRMGLERQAGLRALATKMKAIEKPTEDEISEAWQSEYGEKVQIRLFVIPQGSMDVASKFRTAIEKDKKAPEVAAKDNGIPDPASWTISKNAKGNGIEKIRDVAFAKNPGELAPPIEFNGQQVMIFLDKKEPSTTVANPLTTPAVKNKVVSDLINYRETLWMNNRLAKLRQEAQNSFTINDPVLRQQFQAIYDAQMAQQNATTNPASGGAVTPPPSVPSPMSMPALPPAAAPATAPGRGR